MILRIIGLDAKEPSTVGIISKPVIKGSKPKATCNIKGNKNGIELPPSRAKKLPRMPIE
jgi:hypothetical protein